MNRIVLIGNGFDLAHDLKTSYKDFIEWYWNNVTRKFIGNMSTVYGDMLCELKIIDEKKLLNWNVFAYKNSYFKDIKRNRIIPGIEVLEYIKEHKDIFSIHFKTLLNKISESIETKGWVDIENDYYSLLKEYAFEESAKEKLISLNAQLEYLKLLLVDYLKSIENEAKPIDIIKEKIYAPIRIKDISVEGQSIVKDLVNQWKKEPIWNVKNKIRGKIQRYGLKIEDYAESIDYFHANYRTGKCYYTDVPAVYMLPDAVTLLSFNYTKTPVLYHNEYLGLINYIHGKVDAPNSVIFGYGDELDAKFKELQNLDNDECLKNVKTIRYLESDNYRSILAFMESAPYQVYIMGHSCGNSDRTLLNTLFEHKNCISIKPYYYRKENGMDNYNELIQNISRNFTDMKLMRDRVVNKEYCEFLVP